MTKIFWLCFLILLSTPSHSSTDYCLALRGNGEAQPAHWGALARLVETIGLPKAQSGGSSAAVSGFLLESIASNPWIKEASEKEKNHRASFLIKALHGMAITIATSPQAQESVDLLQYIKGLQANIQDLDIEVLSQISDLKNSEQLLGRKEQILSVLLNLQSLGIGTTQPYLDLTLQLSTSKKDDFFDEEQFNHYKFYAEELYQALKAFGTFNAENNPFIFFRQGLINFSDFAKSVGRVATFLSGSTWSNKTSSAFDKLVNRCLQKQIGISWQQLITDAPECQEFLKTTYVSFFSQEHNWPKDNVVYNTIGEVIPSFPSTSVLTNSAFENAKTTMVRYHDHLDIGAAKDFKIEDPNDIRFGYWGPNEQLNTIEQNFKKPFNVGSQSLDFTADAKSSKFISLGSASWLKALSFSPAEPGLAPLQPFKIKEKIEAYSAGGWPDLHPVLLLKAAECENVVYVTRKGGESLFAQSVAKLLLNLKRAWTYFNTSTPEAKKESYRINNLGDTSDETSLWSRLYNVANPESSFMKSVSLADTVICTDWDRFDVKTELVELIDDGYNAPFIVPKDSLLKDKIKSTKVKMLESEELSSDWVGCKKTK